MLTNTITDNQNLGLIVLRRDGMFWRAHEQSAYLLKNHFWSDLKVSWQKNEMLSVGFPAGSLRAKVLDRLPRVEGSFVIEKTETCIRIQCPSMNGFEEWKQSLIALRELATGRIQPFKGKFPLYKAVYDFYIQQDVTRKLALQIS